MADDPSEDVRKVWLAGVTQLEALAVLFARMMPVIEEFVVARDDFARTVGAKQKEFAVTPEQFSAAHAEAWGMDRFERARGQLVALLKKPWDDAH